MYNSDRITFLFCYYSNLNFWLGKKYYLSTALFYKFILDTFRSQDRVFPDRRMANPLSPRALKASCHNLCSNSRIRSDACLLTSTATKILYE